MVAFDLFAQNITVKELFGAASTLLAFAAYIPFLVLLIKKEIHPHAFTWLIWGLSAGVVWFFQYTEDGGPGAWTSALDSITGFFIAALAIRNGMGPIAKSDWAAFMTALLALPLCWITKSPVASVILISCVDILSYYPTLRKTYSAPYDEAPFIYLSEFFEIALTLVAMNAYSIATILDPVCVLAMNLLLVGLIIVRRAQTERKPSRVVVLSFSNAKRETVRNVEMATRQAHRKQMQRTTQYLASTIVAINRDHPRPHRPTPLTTAA